MFALRRVAFRALQYQHQPVRQLSGLRPISSAFQAKNTTPRRSFHQSRIWLAEEEQKHTQASEAEQGEVEPTTTEPSMEEQENEIREESIATPEVADAAQDTSPPPATESAAQEITQEVKNATEAAKEVATGRQTNTDALSSSTGSTQSQRPTSTGNKPAQKVLYCGNLFFEVTTAQLEAEFTHFGQIVNSRIVTDPRGMSKGFGYVEFATQEQADAAVSQLDQKVFQGRRMTVQYHQPRESRDRTRPGDRRMGDKRGPGMNQQPSKTLFVGNMSYQMSDRDLNDLFREIRNVLDVRVAIDRKTGQPRGFAHADFIDIASAEKAKAHLEQKVIYGRQLRVDYSASAPTERPARSREGGEDSNF